MDGAERKIIHPDKTDGEGLELQAGGGDSALQRPDPVQQGLSPSDYENSDPVPSQLPLDDARLIRGDGQDRSRPTGDEGQAGDSIPAGKLNPAPPGDGGEVSVGNEAKRCRLFYNNWREQYAHDVSPIPREAWNAAWFIRATYDSAYANPPSHDRPSGASVSAGGVSYTKAEFDKLRGQRDKATAAIETLIAQLECRPFYHKTCAALRNILAAIEAGK